MMKKAMIGIACLALTLTACGNQKPAEAPTQEPFRIIWMKKTPFSPRTRNCGRRYLLP